MLPSKGRTKSHKQREHVFLRLSDPWICIRLVAIMCTVASVVVADDTQQTPALRTATIGNEEWRIQNCEWGLSCRQRRDALATVFRYKPRNAGRRPSPGCHSIVPGRVLCNRRAKLTEKPKTAARFGCHARISLPRTESKPRLRPAVARWCDRRHRLRYPAVCVQIT